MMTSMRLQTDWRAWTTIRPFARAWLNARAQSSPSGGWSALFSEQPRHARSRSSEVRGRMISARGFFSRRLHNEWLRSAPQTMSKTLDDRSQQIVRLDRFNARGFDRGRSRFVQALWLIFGGLFVSSGVPELTNKPPK